MDLPTYIFGTTQTTAYRVLREHVHEVLSKYELTPAHWSALGIICEARDGVRQADIAQAMHVKAPLVTLIARQLEAKELIHSVRNQFDARAKLLAITADGRKLVKIIEAELHTILEKLLKGLSQQELAAYRKVLETIIKNESELRP